MANVRTSKKKRQRVNRIERNMSAFIADGWEQRSEWHFQRKLLGHTLDYWPSSRKFQFQGRVMQGDVEAFIMGWEAIAAKPEVFVTVTN